jgi:hypothetical protein
VAAAIPELGLFHVHEPEIRKAAAEALKKIQQPGK